MKLRHHTFDHRRGRYEVVSINAGPHTSERIVPPAGEKYAFNVDRYRDDIEVYESPTGRSVRVWWNGIELSRPLPAAPPEKLAP